MLAAFFSGLIHTIRNLALQLVSNRYFQASYAFFAYETFRQIMKYSNQMTAHSK
jgi:hypothetical protein